MAFARLTPSEDDEWIKEESWSSPYCRGMIKARLGERKVVVVMKGEGVIHGSGDGRQGGG